MTLIIPSFDETLESVMNFTGNEPLKGQNDAT
jgi:hypothetical protein